MEPASFAVGLIGLAGPCLEAMDRVQLYRSFTRDTAALDVIFDTERLRVENWGRAMGIVEGKLPDDHHPALSEELREVIVKAYRLAIDICDTGDARKLRSLRASPVDTSAGSQQSLVGVRGESRRYKLAWALGGEPKRAKEAALLKALVDELHQSVAPGSSQADNLLTEIRKVTSLLEVKIRQDLHAWLRHAPDERYNDSLRRRLEGTCGWILEKPAFIEWASPEFPSGVKLFWIHGPAGFGKTILCANIVEHITKTLPAPIAHFFFSSDLDSRDDTTVALRSWLSQTAMQHDAAFQYILQRRQVEIDPTATDNTIGSLFKNVVRLVAGGTFIVDGLDECTHLEGPKSVTSFISTLIATTAGTDTRVLVVSRSLSTIQHALQNNDYSTVSEVRIRPVDLRTDIVAYSRYVVDTQLSKKRDNVRSSLSEAMAERYEGQFMWL